MPPGFAEALPEQSGELHDYLPSAPADKEAVEQLVKEGSQLLERLQGGPGSAAPSQSNPSMQTAEGKPSAVDRPKYVVLEEALEYEVRQPSIPHHNPLSSCPSL